jgi:molybdate/tungstate transport system substrate-binding protein
VNAGVADWYVAFAQAPLVIGYNPRSRFAAELRSQPWQRVMAEPGFRLGGTDPQLDPKGQLTAQLLRKVAPDLLPRLQVFPEEDLVGRLQTGQLDAGFFYANEAAEAKIPTVAIPGAPAATFTVTILPGAPDPRGAAAFVRFLLGARGQALLEDDGLTVLQPPRSHGQVPAGLLGG